MKQLWHHVHNRKLTETTSIYNILTLKRIMTSNVGRKFRAVAKVKSIFS